MFCGNCGTKTADTAKFCPSCGASMQPINVQPVDVQSANEPVGTAGYPVMNNNQGMKKAAGDGSKKKKIMIIAAVIVAVLAVWFLFFRDKGGASSYKEAVKIYIDASMSESRAETEKIFDVFPKELLDYALEEEGYSKSDLLDELMTMKEYYSYLGNWSYSYEIVYQEDVEKEEIDELNAEMREEGIKMKVSAAKELEVELTIKTEDYGDMSETMYLTVIKSDGKWFIFPDF